MLYSEIISVCSQIHTKHINTLCGQNAELDNVQVLCNGAGSKVFPNCSARHGIGKRSEMLRGKLC